VKAEIRQVSGLTLVGKANSGHWVTMDASEQLGGSDAGARPLELFLLGLGGCTSMDVISILQKKRVKLDDYECIMEADQTEQHPKVFTRVKITLIFYGDDIPKEAVERAIELSETKYCPASAMLKKSTEIEIGYEIRSSK
jgi:putative redox protein